MRTKHHNIRAILRQYPDGLTSAEITRYIDGVRDTVQGALNVMPDVYIDRWIQQKGKPAQAVWIAMIPPENCPKPN